MQWCLFAGSIAEQFLSSTATQLTYHGLCELTSTVQEGELCVFFRNNHFSTMTKHKVAGHKWHRSFTWEPHRPSAPGLLLTLLPGQQVALGCFRSAGRLGLPGMAA